MKKNLLFILLLVLSQLGVAHAQKLTISPDSLFFAPDTVCINQPITLVPDSSAYHASSYYWGFCSGYLLNKPSGENLGNHYGFHIPSSIDIVEDSGNYYGFVVNFETTELIRLNFGNSLTNTPTYTNFGNLDNGLPVNPNSLYIVRDTLGLKWFVFVAGGTDSAHASLGRVDFGPHLSNPHPNVANFGNYLGMLRYPTGLFVAQNSDYLWYGYVVDKSTNSLIRLDFSYNVSTTPLLYNYGNIAPGLSGQLFNAPSDLAAVYDHNNWYLFITNQGLSNDIARVDLGPTLAPTQAGIGGTIIGEAVYPSGASSALINSFNYRISAPSSITITKDCGDLYLFVTDSITDQLIGIQMGSVTGPYNSVDYNNVGAENYPSAISSIIRYKDDLYGFITNPRDSTLTRIDFDQCANASIPSFAEIQPPVFNYDSPGVYNVYFVINQGLPTMRVDCKTITAIKYPSIAMNDDTTLCQGDTIRLYANSTFADSIRWQSGYNIDTTNLRIDSVKVWPQYSTKYPVILYYPNGCIVDTSVRVHVSTVHADAGPDRSILDGATTVLGGPNTDLYDTSNYRSFGYSWFPVQFLSDPFVPFPIAQPPYDYTYYLTVTEFNDTFKCKATDTVVIHLICGDVYLPNAFAPNSESVLTNRFKILNSEIIQLNYFRIYDRWGTEMFETTDPTQGWDGTYKGKPQPVDVYVWEADIFCTNGKEFKKAGNVSLMR